KRRGGLARSDRLEPILLDLERLLSPSHIRHRCLQWPGSLLGWRASYARRIALATSFASGLIPIAPGNWGEVGAHVGQLIIGAAQRIQVHVQHSEIGMGSGTQMA